MHARKHYIDNENGREHELMDSMTAEQVRRNRQAQIGWDLYAPHRRRVTEFVTSTASPRQDNRLCVLGAGNCNDLDLERLVDDFREVHLVDLDNEALEFALTQQKLAHSKRIIRHSDVDVTRVVHRLARMADAASGSPARTPPLTEQQVTDRLVKSDTDAVQECIDQARQTVPLDLPAPFDAVVSVGLLTQLIDSVVLALGTEHPRFVELMQAIRLGHLQLLIDLAQAGGTALLTTEVVSSDTVPSLPSVSESDLASTLLQLIHERNFFTGTNPWLLQSLFQTDPILAGQVETVEILPPWLWTFISRTYAVVALRVKKKVGTGSDSSIRVTREPLRP